jgi:hypothetical protein
MPASSLKQFVREHWKLVAVPPGVIVEFHERSLDHVCISARRTHDGPTCWLHFRNSRRGVQCAFSDNDDTAESKLHWQAAGDEVLILRAMEHFAEQFAEAARGLASPPCAMPDLG